VRELFDKIKEHPDKGDRYANVISVLQSQIEGDG
jgi:hypothetical protein